MSPPRKSNLILVAFVVLISILYVESDSEEIRSSHHGLAKQNSPTSKSPEMTTFFKGAPSNMALPEARNLSDPFWSIAAKVTPMTVGGRHTREEGRVLLVASLACGGVGLVLMIGTLAVYLIHLRRSKQQITRNIPLTREI